MKDLRAQDTRGYRKSYSRAIRDARRGSAIMVQYGSCSKATDRCMNCKKKSRMNDMARLMTS